MTLVQYIYFFVQDIYRCTRENELLFYQGGETCNTRTLKGLSGGTETGFNSLKKTDVKLSTVEDGFGSEDG